MCGIVGAIAEREVKEILLEGLKRLEYRGYDSAGLALISPTSNTRATTINTIKTVGKVNKLVTAAAKTSVKASGRVGIAHTRWATHGKPSVANAHPHMSGPDIALVHNGIIENYEALRVELKKRAIYSLQTPIPKPLPTSFTPIVKAGKSRSRRR